MVKMSEALETHRKNLNKQRRQMKINRCKMNKKRIQLEINKQVQIEKDEKDEKDEKIKKINKNKKYPKTPAVTTWLGLCVLGTCFFHTNKTMPVFVCVCFLVEAITSHGKKNNTRVVGRVRLCACLPSLCLQTSGLFRVRADGDDDSC